MVGVPANYKNSTLYTHEQRRFRYADVDKDHKLTVKEFVYFLNPDEGKHMLDAIVEVKKERNSLCTTASSAPQIEQRPKNMFRNYTTSIGIL